MPPLETTNDEQNRVVSEPTKVPPSSSHPKSPQAARAPGNDPILRSLYFLLVYLCIGMFIWIIFLPASWLVSRSQYHREVVLPFLDRIHFFWILPRVTVTKFQGHLLAEFTHILPGAAWVALIPFQLHPSMRRKYPKAHRWLGYLFVALSLSIAIGIFIMQYKRLTYDYFFPELPPRIADTTQIPATWLVTSWFAWTGIHAVQLARAKQYTQHQVYMIRHVASGVWVSTQRMIIFPLVNLICYLVLPPPREISRWFQREAFGGTANLAMIMTALVGEYAIRRLQYLKTRPAVDREKKSS